MQMYSFIYITDPYTVLPQNTHVTGFWSTEQHVAVLQ